MNQFELLVPKVQLDTLLSRPKYLFEVKIVKPTGLSSTGPVATYQDESVSLELSEKIINVTPKKPIKTVSVSKRDDLVERDTLYTRIYGTLLPVPETAVIAYDTILRTPDSVLFITFSKDAEPPVVSQTSASNFLPIFMAFKP